MAVSGLTMSCAPDSKETCGGSGTTPWAGTSAYSAQVRVAGKLLEAYTRWPAARWFTPSPTAATTPEHSLPAVCFLPCWTWSPTLLS